MKHATNSMRAVATRVVALFNLASREHDTRRRRPNAAMGRGKITEHAD